MRTENTATFFSLKIYLRPCKMSATKSYYFKQKVIALCKNYDIYLYINLACLFVCLSVCLSVCIQ